MIPSDTQPSSSPPFGGSGASRARPTSREEREWAIEQAVKLRVQLWELEPTVDRILEILRGDESEG